MATSERIGDYVQNISMTASELVETTSRTYPGDGSGRIDGRLGTYYTTTNTTSRTYQGEVRKYEEGGAPI